MDRRCLSRQCWLLGSPYKWGGAQQEWPAGIANEPRWACKQLQTVTHKAQITAGCDSKVQELPEGLEAEGETRTGDRQFCSPGEVGLETVACIRERYYQAHHQKDRRSSQCTADTLTIVIRKAIGTPLGTNTFWCFKYAVSEGSAAWQKLHVLVGWFRHVRDWLRDNLLHSS